MCIIIYICVYSSIAYFTFEICFIYFIYLNKPLQLQLHTHTHTRITKTYTHKHTHTFNNKTYPYITYKLYADEIEIYATISNSTNYKTV